MVKKSNNWNLREMQETLVKDTEQRISDGFQEIASASVEPKPTENVGGEKPQPSALSLQPSEKEPTKGVQTYIPMSMYHAAERHQADTTREYRCTGGTSHRTLAGRAGGKTESGKSYIVGHQVLAIRGGKSYIVGHLHITIQYNTLYIL